MARYNSISEVLADLRTTHGSDSPNLPTDGSPNGKASYQNDRHGISESFLTCDPDFSLDDALEAVSRMASQKDLDMSLTFDECHVNARHPARRQSGHLALTHICPVRYEYIPGDSSDGDTHSCRSANEVWIPASSSRAADVSDCTYYEQQQPMWLLWLRCVWEIVSFIGLLLAVALLLLIPYLMVTMS